jgi:hypothetical protein
METPITTYSSQVLNCHSFAAMGGSGLFCKLTIGKIVCVWEFKTGAYRRTCSLVFSALYKSRPGLRWD